VAISAVTRADGRQVAGDWTIASGQAIETSIPISPTLAVAIPPTPEGTAGTTLDLLIAAPDGRVQAVDLRLDPQASTVQTAGNFRVQFVAARDPYCGFPGTLAASYGGPAVGTLPVAVPPGADGVVAFALAQVGRQYCWSGKGWTPCTGLGVTPPCASYPCWDCSGLAWGAYNAIGVSILHGTSNQQHYPQVPLEQIQPGDLMLFGGINENGRAASISHVGIYAGDVTGDGSGDLIHAANYPDGVVITNAVLTNPWYRQHLVLVTRPPRGGGR
jgi:cell wall-associated NlpC family hydrolase